MTSTPDNDDIELYSPTLFALIRTLSITYDDTCNEVSGWNLSVTDNIPISILNLEKQRSITDLDKEDANFMWKSLLIDCLISMDYRDNDNRDDLVRILKNKYKKDQDNLNLIDEFHMNYKKTDAIRWYKKQSCIYQELNKALRSSCMNLIFAYRFFIRDLSEQLREEQTKLSGKNGGNIIHLYRGQSITIEEIDKLQKLKAGCLISVDSFFSTSRDLNTAVNFMNTSNDDIKKVPLLYEIKCDLRLNTKPYADISSPSLGDFHEEAETLFMIGTIFRFKGIYYDKKLKSWRVKLKLIDENSHRLSKLYESIKSEMGEETNLLTLGSLLVNAGDFEHALRIYMRSLFDLILFNDNLTKEEHKHVTQSLLGIATVQCELGRYDESIQLHNETIKYINNNLDKNESSYYKATTYYGKSLPFSEKGQYFDALKQCQHALKIFTKYNGYNDSLVANCYEMIGNIYGNLGRLEKVQGNSNGQYQRFQTAFKYYNKALEVRKEVHKEAPDHYEISVTYINIGELFRDMGRSNEALQYTLTAYNSFLEAFPKSHNWIGVTLDNIGEIYVLQQRFTEAKEKYDEAIDVFNKTLPNDHRFIGETLHNIGKLYCCIYQFDTALNYFDQAKKIYDKKIPDNHYLAVELREQTNYASVQLYG